jgi:16S rRNA (guanine527-N7)-methyltransferase
MLPAQIADLLRPFLLPIPASCHSEKQSAEEPAVLSPSRLQAISTYIDILLRWNARINLTAIRDPKQIVTRHFGESFFAARTLFHVGADAPSAPERSEVSEANTAKNRGVETDESSPSAPEVPANDHQPAANRLSVADLGSGAGFPGLPIKLWAPQISLTLIESNHKKATFLREVVRALTLTDVNVATARAESLTGLAFDVVTLRAVERFETILPVAASLVAPGGRLALLIGSTQFAAAQEHLSASSAGFKWTRPQPIPLSRTRVLAIASR